MADQSLSATVPDASLAPAAEPASDASAAPDDSIPAPTDGMTAAVDAPAEGAPGASAPPAMVPPLAPYGVSTPPVAGAAARCPWCSAELPVGETDRCPTCGANLIPEGDPAIPGVTEVVGQAQRALPTEPTRRSSRLLSWISGDIEPDPVSINVGDDAPPEAFAPPPRDVRREMLRLQLEAEGITVIDDEPAPDGPEGSSTATGEPTATAPEIATPASATPASASPSMSEPTASVNVAPMAAIDPQASPDPSSTQLQG